MNKMADVYLEKLVLNIGIGQNEQGYNSAKALLEKLTSHTAMPTKAKKRDPSLKIRKGQVIGAMVTLRKDEATEMLRKALDAVNNSIKESAITDNSLSFGIKEYIDFTGIKYDPKIGMLGMNVNATFSRKGKRTALRRRARGFIKKTHAIVGRDEIAKLLADKFNVKIGAEQ